MQHLNFLIVFSPFLRNRHFSVVIQWKTYGLRRRHSVLPRKSFTPAARLEIPRSLHGKFIYNVKKCSICSCDPRRHKFFDCNHCGKENTLAFCNECLAAKSTFSFSISLCNSFFLLVSFLVLRIFRTFLYYTKFAV